MLQKQFRMLNMMIVLYPMMKFDEEYMNDIWENNYENPMAYQLLSSKCFMRDKYIEAIFYVSKAKDILLQENNFKRFIVVNRMLLTSMLCAKNYKEIYRLININISS